MDLFKESLKDYLEDEYQLNILKINMLRDIIGTIYHILAQQGEYILKLYKQDTFIDVNQPLYVIEYLKKNNFPVPRIIYTSQGNRIINFKGRKGVVFDYIQGHKVDKSKHKHLVLETHAKMKNLMKKYRKNLNVFKYNYYGQRYLDILKTLGYPKDKITKIRNYTELFYRKINEMPKGFVHGDFHTGNMILKNGKVFLLDFDTCNMGSSNFDLVTFFDQIDFNSFSVEKFKKTIGLLSQIDVIDETEIPLLMAYLPLRHCEIIANIYESDRNKKLAQSFLEEQFHWIEDFYNQWLLL